MVGAVRAEDGIIELLNEVLTGELTAVNQYFVDARIFDNWGYQRLGHHFYEESVGEMKDADSLIQRILYLDGLPNLQRLGQVRIGETASEKLTLALELESQAIERLNRGIALSVERGDNGTRELLAHVLTGEEEAADWLETQLAVVEQLGEHDYLAQQLHRD
jgi:bacterioferritin